MDNKWLLDDGGKSSVGLFGVLRPPRKRNSLGFNELRYFFLNIGHLLGE
jgi:hypothetical protein